MPIPLPENSKPRANDPAGIEAMQASEGRGKGKKGATIEDLAATAKKIRDKGESVWGRGEETITKAEKPATLQPRTMEEARNWLKAQKVLIDSGMEPSKEFLALIGLKKPTDDPLFSFGKEKIIAAVKALQKEVRAVDDGVFGRATYLAVLNKYPDKYADARSAALGAKSETKIVAELGRDRRKEREIPDLQDIDIGHGESLLAAAEKLGGPKVQYESSEEKLARAEWRKAKREKESIGEKLDTAKKAGGTDTTMLEKQYAAAEKAEATALEKGARAQHAADLKRQEGAAAGD